MRAFNAAYHTANRLLARKPAFVVIGTGRCGTGFFSALCKANGVYCAHEGYFTPEGPTLRNPHRRFTAKGDASWLAVPFLPDPEIRIVHQVRHPIKVIQSYYNIGFFDPSHDERRIRYVNFARRYFDWSEDPLRSCVRWYIEWNERCELLTDCRYRVEDLDTQIGQVGRWIGFDLRPRPVVKDTNSRAPKVNIPFEPERVRDVPEYPKLMEVAKRYGYAL